MFKKSVLFFLCFMLLAMPGCKKKLPTQPDIPEVLKPLINYFLVLDFSIKLGDSTTLSWDTYGATTINISPGIGNVSAKGEMQISPEETTTYTLTATNSAGSATRTCTVEILNWAVLEYSTIPANPIFTYYPLLGGTFSDFMIVLNETNGVRGHLSDVRVESADPACYNVGWGAGSFNAYGRYDIYCSLVIPCKPDYVIVSWEGTDDNGYIIQENIWYILFWTQNKATAQFFKIVEGPNHHKLIN